MKIKDRVVIFPDTHFPNHDKKAFACALNVLKEVKPLYKEFGFTAAMLKSTLAKERNLK